MMQNFGDQGRTGIRRNPMVFPLRTGISGTFTVPAGLLEEQDTSRPQQEATVTARTGRWLLPLDIQ